MKKHTSSLILAAVASFVASLCLILTPFYLGRAIDFMVGVNTVNFMGVSYNLSLALFMYILSFVFTSISTAVPKGRWVMCLPLMVNTFLMDCINS